MFLIYVILNNKFWQFFLLETSNKDLKESLESVANALNIKSKFYLESKF